MSGPWLAWRAATPEERANARVAHAEAWARAGSRLAAARGAIEAAREGQIGFVGIGLSGAPQMSNYESEPPTVRVRGVFIHKFEVSSFSAAEANSAEWWTWLSGAARRQLENCLKPEGARLSTGPFGYFELEAEGIVETGEGGYGHLGHYPAAFYIERLHSVRVLTAKSYRARRMRELSSSSSDP